MSALRPLVGRLVRVVGARGHDDRGQLSILILGLTVIAMTLIIGGLAVTSAQISRMRMLDAADSAALEATDEGTERIYEEGLGETLPVSDEVVRRSAAEHLASREKPHGIESWAVAEGTGSPDGHTAVVVLRGEADLPLIGGLLESLGGSVTVTVESRARADVVDGAP